MNIKFKRKNFTISCYLWTKTAFSKEKQKESLSEPRTWISWFVWGDQWLYKTVIVDFFDFERQKHEKFSYKRGKSISRTSKDFENCCYFSRATSKSVRGDRNFHQPRYLSGGKTYKLRNKNYIWWWKKIQHVDKISSFYFWLSVISTNWDYFPHQKTIEWESEKVWKEKNHLFCDLI